MIHPMHISHLADAYEVFKERGWEIKNKIIYLFLSFSAIFKTEKLT